MPIDENNDLSPGEVFEWLVTQVHTSGQEWTEEELRKLELGLNKFAQNQRWATQYLNDHPAEKCIDEEISSEFDRIQFVQKEIMLFLNKVGDNLDNPKFKAPLNEAVYEIISAYYPNITWEVFLQEIENLKGTKRKTILRKGGTKQVVAAAAAKTFQDAIEKCCQNVDENKCLCLLTQTLIELDMDSVSIGKLINKTGGAARKFRERCIKRMNEHAEQFNKTENQE
jgi:histone H3/H4